jgi:phytanoyl-CoA hydroxylase
MITKDQAQFFHDNGYLLIENVLDMETIETMRSEIANCLQRMSDINLRVNRLWDGEWLSEDERKNQKLDAIHDMQFQSGVFTKMLMNDILLDAMEVLMGPNIQLHHTKVLAKPPKSGGGFPMHQDYPYFPHEKHSMVAVSIYLDDADEENGCICVYPGSHKKGPMECAPNRFYLPPKEWPLDRGVAAKGKAGDAVVFNYLTVHGSPPNRSNRPRRNILLQLRDPADRPTNEMHQSRGQGMMLRGTNPNPFGTTWEENKETEKAG